MVLEPDLPMEFLEEKKWEKKVLKMHMKLSKGIRINLKLANLFINTNLDCLGWETEANINFI